MTGITHMLAATAIYKFTSFEKPVGLAMAFVSHFVLDAIPHYELTKKTNYILGIIGGLISLLIALLNKDAILLFATFLGALPDLNTLFFKNHLLNSVHNRFHSKLKIRRPWISIGFELTLSSACILLLGWR